VRELGRQVRATLDPAAVVRLTADALGPATGADRIAIRPVLDDELGALETEWTHEATTPAGSGAPVDPHPDLFAHVYGDLAAGRTVLIEDTFHHPELSPEALAVFTDAGWGSIALVPVTEDGEVGALIALEARDPGHRWPPDAIRLAEAMASEMGRARHTARLFARERAMVERLRELDQAKTDFVSSVSHELRTPLTSIRGYVEMLRDGDAGQLDPGQVRMLGVVERNTDRLLALIEDLLTLSRIESGAFRTTLADIDLAALLRSCAEVVEVQARAGQVALVVDVDPDLPGVRGDGHQLERVVLNLLTNAIKFSPPGSTATLRAVRQGEEARIDVIDEGMGIPEAEQARLFSRFFRSSTAQEKAVPGTGLGLVIAKAAVDNHGGSITVDSAPGRGTTFTVVLPGQPVAVAR
jgi:signal transduction histidine kinase